MSPPPRTRERQTQEPPTRLVDTVLPPDPAVPGRRVLRAGRGAWSVRLRVLAVPALGLVLIFVAVAVSVSRGTSTLDLGDVVTALLGGGDRRTSGIVLGLRLPRALTGVLVGAALGLSGAVFQTLARTHWPAPTSSASRGGPRWARCRWWCSPGTPARCPGRSPGSGCRPPH